MSEYLRNLPERASLGFIFDDLYNSTGKLVQGLEGRRLMIYGEGSDQKVVPGTDLLLDWSESATSGDGNYLTAHVLTEIEGEEHRLMSVMAFHPGRGSDAEPAAVSANRANESGSDYLLRRQTSDQGDMGMITVALQDRGVEEGHLAEPTGHTARPPETPMAILLEREGVETSKRLEVVTQGILDGLELAEMIRYGTPAVDAFMKMGRPVATAV